MYSDPVLKEEFDSLRKRLMQAEGELNSLKERFDSQVELKWQSVEERFGVLEKKLSIAPPLKKTSLWKRAWSFLRRRIASVYSPIVLGGLFVLAMVQPTVVIVALLAFFGYLSVRAIVLIKG